MAKPWKRSNNGQNPTGKTHGKNPMREEAAAGMLRVVEISTARAS